MTRLQYARKLWASNWVVWASLSALPDLGGKQLDDARSAVQATVS